MPGAARRRAGQARQARLGGNNPFTANAALLAADMDTGRPNNNTHAHAHAHRHTHTMPAALHVRKPGRMYPSLGIRVFWRGFAGLFTMTAHVRDNPGKGRARRTMRGSRWLSSMHT